MITRPAPAGVPPDRAAITGAMSGVLFAGALLGRCGWLRARSPTRRFGGYAISAIAGTRLARPRPPARRAGGK